MQVNNQVTTITTPLTAVKPLSFFTAEKLLNGTCGYPLQALALQAVNYTSATAIANHADVKMPTAKLETPDQFRDLIFTNPEFETATRPTLDQLSNANIASCALIRDLAEVQESNNGKITRPYAWLAERAQTPTSAILRQYAWFADQSAKLAGEQARLLHIADYKQVEDNAKDRTNANNRERVAFALAEVNSSFKEALLIAPPEELVNILLDLDGFAYNIVALTQAGAQRNIEYGKQRLLKGDYTSIDPEVLLFSQL